MAATNQNVSPEPVDALPEGAQLIDIPGNSMVLVVAVDDLPKPYTNLTDAIMLPAEKTCEMLMAFSKQVTPFES